MLIFRHLVILKAFMMNSDVIQKILSYTTKFLFLVLGGLLVMSVISIEANKKPAEERAEILEEQTRLRQIFAESKKGNENLPEVWPANMNDPYPDIKFLDQNGKELALYDLKGRVVILEYIDISSPISQAQSGAAVIGAYHGSTTSQDIDKYSLPFSDVLKKSINAGFSLPNNSIIELKVLVYGASGAQATVNDAQNWANHFALGTAGSNVIVAVTKKDFRSKRSDSLIGGFQLLDRNLLLRVDSSGPKPKHNLSMTLLPLVPKLIR